MIGPESAERAAGFWYSACEAVYNAIPQASLQKRPSGMRVLTTRTPVSVLNGLIATTHEPDLEELSALAATYRSTAPPWSIQLRNDNASPAVAETANRCGLKTSVLAPFMIKRLVESDMRKPENPVVLR